MVLADPGMGKSTLLRMEVCQAVTQAKNDLKRKDLELEKKIDVLTIPVFVRLSSLVDNHVIDLPLEDAILKIMEISYSAVLQELKFLRDDENTNTIAFLQDLLKEKLRNGKCLFLLDALDEVPQKKQHILVRKLETFISNYKDCRIIMTSRIVGYGGEFGKICKEMEIIPFDNQKTEEYIQTWFTNAEKHLQDNSVTPQGLIQALRERPQLSGLAQNPLLLSLICSLYQRDQLNLPARREEIYEQAVNYLLEDWAIDDEREKQNTTQITRQNQILREIAYEFSKEGLQVFSDEKLIMKIENSLKQHDLVKETDEYFIELSEKTGILSKLSLDKKSKANKKYMFLHRTFQEYFTASYFKYQIEENDQETGINLVKQYLWDYNWHETIILLAGLLDEPIVLIEAIRAEIDEPTDNYFLHII